MEIVCARIVVGSKQCEDWVVNGTYGIRGSIREGWQGASWATSGDGGCGPSGERRSGGKLKVSIGGPTTQAAVGPLDLARCFQRQSPHASSPNWIAPRSAEDSSPPHKHQICMSFVLSRLAGIRIICEGGSARRA